MLEYAFPDTPEPGCLREVAPGVHWLRMPLPLALDHINLYLLEDSDGWWVVDTGIAIGPTEELWRQVFEQHLGDKPVKAVLSTHYHPDHIGMAGWFMARGAELWTTRTAYVLARMLQLDHHDDVIALIKELEL